MKPIKGHLPNCPYTYAWDVAGECGVVCCCPDFRACDCCGMRWTKRHNCQRKQLPRRKGAK